MTTHLATCDCDSCLIRRMRSAVAAERRQGWDAWYRRDAPALMAYLAWRGHAMACATCIEDILQESFVAGFHNVSTGRFVEQGASLSAYLRGIAKNLLLEACRLHRRELAGSEQLESVPTVEKVSVEDRLELAALCALVQEAQAQQPPLQQRVTAALYAEGRPSGEVAAEVGKSAGNTRIIAHRAVGEMVHYLAYHYNLQLSAGAVRAVLETL